MKLFIALAGFCWLVGLSGDVSAYDSPDFDAGFLDVDALFLSANERESLVEALAAVACNFPESVHVDDDLREKALLIALTLNPLHPSSRNAHRDLLAGRVPEPNGFFSSSVSEVSEQLWSSAGRLGGDPRAEPEGRKLALHLGELSLLLNPSPSRERIAEFVAMKREVGDPGWDKALTLQPETHASGRKMENLLDSLKKAAPGRATVSDQRGKGSGMTTANPPRTRMRPEGKLSGPDGLTPSVELPFVARYVAPSGRGYTAGLASVSVADPRPMAAGNKGSGVRLVSGRTGPRFGGLDNAERFMRRVFPQWPTRGVMVFGFEPLDGVADTSTEIRGGVVTSLLLQGALSGLPPQAGLLFSGDFSPQAAGPESRFVLDEGQLGELIEQARTVEGIRFLVVPSSCESAVLAAVSESGRLDYLFDPQIISYADWAGLKGLAFEEDPGREAAARSFQEIKLVQEQMALEDLSRNIMVQRRLREIIGQYPSHLSAKVMLSFGEAAVVEE